MDEMKLHEVPSESSKTRAGSMIEGDTTRLRQPFNVYSVIGMTFSLSATPLAVGTYLVFTVGAGGSPFFFFSYLTVSFFNILVFVSLAELASIFPHTSGQIYWTYSTMPRSVTRACTYWSGCFTILGWTFAATGTLLFVASLLLGIVSLCDTSYIAGNYQLYLVALATSLVGLAINVPLFKTMPYVMKATMWMVNTGTIYVFVALLARTTPKQSAHEVFVEVVNTTGWSSNGMAFMLGLLPGLICTGYFDIASHMADEVPRPERQIPQVMLGTAALYTVSGLVMTIVYLFCTVNANKLLDPIAGQPIYQLYHDAFRSTGLEVVAGLFLTFIYFFDVPMMVTTLSRIIWSFSQSKALPISKFLSRVDKRWQLPVNAIVAATVITTLLSLLQLGPSTILDAMFSASIMCLYTSYSMPLVGLVSGGWKAIPGDHYFRLGKIGRAINVLAMLWTWVAVVFTAFPSSIPVTPDSMNWAVAIVGVGAVLAGINWIVHGRHHYIEPKPLVVLQRECYGLDYA